ncbi:MAG: acetylglucosamine transferase [Lautropia sp.]
MAAARVDELDLVGLMRVAEARKGAGDLAGAIALYRGWIAAQPAHPLVHVALFNLGVGLGTVPDSAAAEAVYRDAIAHQPAFVEARINLGTQIEAQGRRGEAIALWRDLLDSGLVDAPIRRPLLRHLLNNLGRALETEREFEAAEAMLARSLALDPAQPDALQHWLHLRQRQCRWPMVAPFAGVDRAAMVRATSPLAMLAAFDDPALQLYRASVFVQQKVLPTLPAEVAAAAAIGAAPQPKSQSKPQPQPQPQPQPPAARRLRIGYLSSDFCQHAVALLTVELFERHDRSRVELTAFSWSRDDGSAVRRRVLAAMDAYVPIGMLDDAAAAARIRDRGIDVLIDLHGLTSGARPGILARRPAPLQLTFLGFPGTTAMPFIDHVIADRYVLPDWLTPFFIERPLYLPHCFQPSDTTRAVGPPPTRAEAGLPADGFVYCSFNNNYKFDAPMFADWMRILRGVPGSVLWLLADNRWAEANLRAAAREHGIGAERLVFAGRIAPDAYLARYGAADLFLDTFPFNAGTTASDALWAGLPLLTRSGRTFASRMAGSLLSSLGLTELIAADADDYVARAIALGRDPAAATDLRRRLAQARTVAPTFDMRQFARDLEDLLLALVPPAASAAGATA